MAVTREPVAVTRTESRLPTSLAATSVRRPVGARDGRAVGVPLVAERRARRSHDPGWRSSRGPTVAAPVIVGVLRGTGARPQV